VVVRDVLGNEVWKGKGDGKVGLHRVDWGLTRGGGGAPGEGGEPRGGRGGRGGRGPGGGGAVAAGSYAVTLKLGDTTRVATFSIEDGAGPLDVSWPRPAGVGEGDPVRQMIEEIEEQEAMEAAGARRYL
jgi:hypothetical protein